MVEPSEDAAVLAPRFAAMTIDVLSGILRNPDEAAGRRKTQMAYIHQNYAWPARALEWQSWLFDLILRQS
jgi:hypothetical protein